MPLQCLVHHAWSEYSLHVTTGYVVRPSIPILYFGDRERYLNSGLRVVTAALNPSKAEFPESDRFLRFRMAGGNEGVPPDVLDGYLSALGTYFQEQPYRQWFNSLEPILEGMGASFYAGRSHTALHTDLCTPLATDPTWSKLPESARSQLIGPGQRIWHELVEFLQPDVILLSVARQHLKAIRFQRLNMPLPLFTVQQKRPYVVCLIPLRLASGKEAHLVFGRAAQTPFGLISIDNKRALGAAVRRKMLDG